MVYIWQCQPGTSGTTGNVVLCRITIMLANATRIEYPGHLYSWAVVDCHSDASFVDVIAAAATVLFLCTYITVQRSRLVTQLLTVQRVLKVNSTFGQGQ